jgi:methyl-accepting chemotaxis protein
VVGAIARNAADQTSALHQVNTTIAQMDRDTQRHTAIVEETTAAIHSLERETQELFAAIGSFKTGVRRSRDWPALARSA